MMIECQFVYLITKQTAAHCTEAHGSFWI